jgi:hypothetical protein
MIGTPRPSGFGSREFSSYRSIGRHCNRTPTGPIRPPARGSAKKANVSFGGKDEESATARGGTTPAAPSAGAEAREVEPYVALNRLVASSRRAIMQVWSPASPRTRS